MIRALTLALVGAGALLTVGTAAEARNYPCSQKKGGVKACQGDKYLCNDGSLSSSKTKCSGK